MKARKKCKSCGGEGVVLNPKYKDIFVFPEPFDYVRSCEECNGSGLKQRHREKNDALVHLCQECYPDGFRHAIYLPEELEYTCRNCQKTCTSPAQMWESQYQLRFEDGVQVDDGMSEFH